MSNLFKSSKQQQTQTSSVNLPSWANTGLQQTAERATNLMTQPYQPYTGQRVAGLSPWTNQGVSGVAANMGFQPDGVTSREVAAPGGYAAQQVTPQQVGARSLAGTNLSAYYDPYEQQVIDATMADIDRSTAQSVAGQTANNVMAGGFGGFGDRAAVARAQTERAGIDAKARTVAGLRSAGFARAQDMAVGDITRDLQASGLNQQAGLTAGMSNQQAAARAAEFERSTGLQAGLANQQAALAAAQGNQQAGLAAANLRGQSALTLAGLGELERGVRQGQADFDYTQFREGRDDPFLKTQWAAGVIGGNAAPYTGNTTSTGTTPGASPFSQIVGGATAVAGLAGLFGVSDPDEKTDKKRLGTDPDTGLGLWAFRYKGDSKRYPKVVGVMADEVARRYPHLVREVGGRQIVDMEGLAALAGQDERYATGGYVMPGFEPVDTLEDLDARLRYAGLRGGTVPEEERPRPGIRWSGVPPERRPLPPLIEGVAEPVPVTEDWMPTPPVAGQQPAMAGPRPPPVPEVPPPPPGPSSVPALAAPGAPPPSLPEQEGQAIVLSPQVQARLDAIRRARAGQAEAGGGMPPVAPRIAPRTPAVQAAAAMPAEREAQVMPSAATSGAARGAAGQEQPGFFTRLGRRLVDPENAGSLALLEAGAAMMASRNPNWAGAIAEGALVGAQSARRSMPLVAALRERREEDGRLQGLIGGLGLPAVAPPIAPGSAPRRGGGGGPGGGTLTARVMGAESGGRDEARNPAPGSTATGAMQITNGMWRTYAPRLGLDPSLRNDRDAQVQVFEAFTGDMRQQLTPVLGREPTDQDIYAAWGLGPAGFRALVANPDGDAFELYQSVAGPDIAQRAFAQNGNLMRRGMTAGQVVDAWRNRLPPGEAGGGGRGEVTEVADRRAPPAEDEGEPTITVQGRRLTRSDLLALQAAAPRSDAVRQFVGTALPMLDREIARRESRAERREARAENLDARREARDANAELRRELARERPPVPSDLARLRAERDALPADHPDRPSYDQAIRRATGQGAEERFTQPQMIALRRDASNAARQEANGLEFDSEADRTAWINQRAQEMLSEWGVPSVRAGAGFAADAVPAADGGAGGGAAAPARPAEGGAARIRPRGPQRVLSDQSRRVLSEAGAQASAFQDLTNTFRDDYGGFVSDWMGEAANTVQRRLPGEAPRADWWAQYQEQKNIIRNRLFGSALTATEKAEFDRAAISPGQSPETIRNNLERQRRAALSAARRLGLSLREAGYNRREIEAALGMEIPDPPAAGGARPGGADRPPLDQFYR